MAVSAKAAAQARVRGATATGAPVWAAVTVEVLPRVPLVLLVAAGPELAPLPEERAVVAQRLAERVPEVAAAVMAKVRVRIFESEAEGTVRAKGAEVVERRARMAMGQAMLAMEEAVTVMVDTVTAMG